MTYTVEFCEREYNNRLLVPDYATHFERWARLGLEFRQRHQTRPGTRLDSLYAETPNASLDYFSCGQGQAPLFVFIHGGYWRSLDKNDFSWIAAPFLDARVDVALLNYALCPHVQIDQIVQQMRQACGWLVRQADGLGFDPHRITIGGHSAGAHLAAMLSCTHWSEWDRDLPNDLVKASLLISGLYDLEPLLWAPFVNQDLRLDAGSAARLSAAYLPPLAHCRVITAVGGLESDEFKRQNQLIAKHWPRNLIADVPMPDTNHFTVVDALAAPSNPLTAKALELCLSA